MTYGIWYAITNEIHCSIWIIGIDSISVESQCTEIQSSIDFIFYFTQQQYILVFIDIYVYCIMSSVARAHIFIYMCMLSLIAYNLHIAKDDISNMWYGNVFLMIPSAYNNAFIHILHYVWSSNCASHIAHALRVWCICANSYACIAATSSAL